MFKKKHFVFHTTADPLDAERLLVGQTVKASPMPDHPIESMKDTFALDKKPFRGEVGGGSFQLTRRRRGRNVRIAVEGRLEPKQSGGTEIKASMSAPKSLWAGLAAGVAALGIIAGGAALGDLPAWVPLLFLGAEGAAMFFANRLYERETSQTFSALRDAIPAQAPEAVAPVSERESEEAAAARAPVPSRQEDR